MNNPQMSSNMMMNNSNNQNNNDFPDQSHIAQIFNQNNSNMNQNMMNNNMNNNMNMMNNSMMRNNMSMMMNNNVNNNMNNSMMYNNNMNNNMMNNNTGMMNNNMNMMNNQMGMNNMGMMNNMRMMNNNMMNNNMMNNNMMNNNMMNNNMMNNNMANNNNNNMGLVRRNTFNQINWYNNNYLPNNMGSQNYLYIMKMLQSQALQRQYYQMMFQQRMFYQMQRQMIAKQNRMSMMNQILDSAFNNNNNQQNDIPQQIDNAPEDNYVPNQALLDVIQETNPPQQTNNQNQNNNPILPSELVSEVIADVINLNPNLLCGLGNNLTGEWAQGENRGGRPYQPPNGWIGYGLNVLNKYDNGNNDWLACNGRPGEWCIAYHGACNGQSSDNVKKGVKSILETNLRPGGGQACKNHNDLNHPGQKVGIGVYCSPSLSVIDGYSGIMNINGHNYKTAFMLRVKPDKIRISASSKDYWVVNGDFSELRPYRLLIKPC